VLGTGNSRAIYGYAAIARQKGQNKNLTARTSPATTTPKYENGL